MTIQSHWTNDNYRDNFERIFGKKNDDAKAEDSTRADGGTAELSAGPTDAEDTTLTCVVRATVGRWQEEPWKRFACGYRTWSTSSVNAANVREYPQGACLWSTHRPDGSILANGSSASLADAKKAADDVLRDFCAKNQEARHP